MGVGPFGVILVFLLLMFWEAIANALGATSVWSHFNCFFGLFAVLDPIVVLLVDLIVGNFNCAAQPICDVDLADEGCFCVEGDAFRLSKFTETHSSSAVIGILLTVTM